MRALQTDMEDIINSCNRLMPNEKFVVFGYGHNHDLTLHICKNEDFDPEKDPDYSNLVDISTKKGWDFCG